MLRANGRRTDPFSVLTKFNTALEYNVYHFVSTSVVGTNFNAAFLPRFEHLITAVPVTEEHHTVMWSGI